MNLRRNTKVKVSVRSRNWCFTWNNYDEKSIDTLTHDYSVYGVEKYIFQEEKGENGTRHLQGVLMFKNARSFYSMKKLFGGNGVHWEPCKNWIASIQYCSKEATRSGKVYSNFDMRDFLVKKERTPFQMLSIDEQHIVMYNEFMNHFQR